MGNKVAMLVGLVWLCAAVGAQSPAPANSARPATTQAQVDRWQTELSNWGRWGKDDTLGSANLITPAKRQQAMALAKTGAVVSLERRVVLSPKPEESKADDKPHGISFYKIRFQTFPPGNPRGIAGYTSDLQEFHVHGGMTHLDAFCHKSADGKLYNGFPLAETVSQETGCTKLGLDGLPDGLVTRGVLVDMTRVKGVSREPGGRVYQRDIEAWEKQTGITVSPGDAVFVYNPSNETGPDGPRRNGEFDISVLPWMKARGVAMTSAVGDIPGDQHADHRLLLVAMGVYLLDGPRLDRLAQTAARLNRWEFLLVVAPLQVPGSTGSPVNPLAMF
jgi:hypothetical protein